MVEVRVQESFQICESNAGIVSDKLYKEPGETGMRGKNGKEQTVARLGIASLSVGSSERCRLPVKEMPACCGPHCFILLCPLRCKQLWKLHV